MAFSSTAAGDARRSVITADDVTSDVTAATGVAALSFFGGALTSYAQGFLPDALSSFANSASGWTLVTGLLVWSVRARPALAAMLGAAAFVLLTVGYSVASAVRGLTYDPTFFAIVGLVVGPFVGLATAWLRERDLRAALATATLSGIALGEAVYGLTVVSATTSPVYWILIGLAGLALLGRMVSRRLAGSVNITLALGLTTVVTAGFVLAYTSLSGVTVG